MKLNNNIIKKIDKGMIPIIKTLNDKNYLTVSCCEGHYKENRRIETYISFKRDYKFTTPPPLYDFIFDETNQTRRTPIYKYPKGNFSIIDGRGNYRWLVNTENERLELLKRLQEWANSLEPRELQYQTVYTLMGRDRKGNLRGLYGDTVKGDYEKIKAQKSKYGYYDFIENEFQEDPW